jgi:CubicO group peptidase (beta-lactamase class C family)
VSARIAASPDTPYLVGDLSQTLAAVLLLQCVDQRHLDLDAPLSTYGLSNPEPDATARELLSHQPPSGPKDFVYSPSRFDTLTALVESCVPQPYRKSVQHRLLDHLAMTDSVPGLDLRDPSLSLPDDMFEQADLDRYRAQIAKMAIGYKVDSKGRPTPNDPGPVTMSAAGGLISTVRDLAQFDKALDTAFDDGGLLGDDTKAAAWSPAIGRSGQAIPMGLGWFVQVYKTDKVIWHFGDVPNAYSSLLVKLPGRGLTLILLANSDGLSAPFQLPAGDVTRSLFASIFLKLIT